MLRIGALAYASGCDFIPTRSVSEGRPCIGHPDDMQEMLLDLSFNRYLPDTAMSELGEFHRCLLAIAKLGGELDWMKGAGDRDLSQQLQVFEAKIEQQQRGAIELQNAVVATQDLPQSYRSALLQWLHTGHSPEAFQGLWEPLHARELRDHHSTVQFQLWILIALFIAGLLILCFQTVPGMISLHEQVSAKPGVVLAILLFLKRTAWIWGPMVALLWMAWGYRLGIHRKYRKIAADPLSSAETQIASLAAASSVEQDLQVLPSWKPLESWIPHSLAWAVSKPLEGRIHRLHRWVRIHAARKWIASKRRYYAWVVLVGGGILALVMGILVFAPTVELMLTIVMRRLP